MSIRDFSQPEEQSFMIRVREYEFGHTFKGVVNKLSPVRQTRSQGLRPASLRKGSTSDKSN